MKKLLLLNLLAALLFIGCGEESTSIDKNKTALAEQAQTEENQSGLFTKQPPPRITWSLERDNLIKRFKLQNDRTVNFYMYVFIEGVADPVGYYMVNKVSSVDSQLTNTSQIVRSNDGHWGTQVLPSPAEDGSYGTNGVGVFGFTPEDIYLETNMHYIVSTVPLSFAHPVQRLAVVNTDEAKQILEHSKQAMK